ncbi:MAG: hypothetical protein ACLTOS_04905 [Ruthenibacterium lactatiformans]
MTVRLLAFTQKGMELARRLAAELSGEAARCGEGCTLDAWTADAFANADALVYVGAAGIAVRAVAPYAGNKASDPAVVAVDECGRFAVPLLSGHLGGANRLARRIGAFAARCPSSPRPRTQTERSPWTSGPCGRVAVCWMCRASNGCRQKYWRAARRCCAAHGPLRARPRRVWRRTAARSILN